MQNKKKSALLENATYSNVLIVPHVNSCQYNPVWLR